jgi:predicted dehydrogenase
MNDIRVGVIGVGYLGQFHAEKYNSLPGAILYGVVDADPTRAAQIAQKLNTRAFSDPERLLGQVDAVSIVVPTAHHYEVAKRFLDHGVHVLLEKPITVTLGQADELIVIANKGNLILQIGHIERYNPAFISVKKLLKSPRYISSERAAPFTVRCTDVNVVLDLMIHDLDIVADLAGSIPREVSAAGASVITEAIDIASARILFQNGCIADVTASRVSDEKKRVLRVFDGNAIYTSDYQTQKAFISQKGSAEVPELTVREVPTERLDTLNEEIKTFLQCIRMNHRPPVSGKEGRDALKLALMISGNISSGITGFAAVPVNG